MKIRTDFVTNSSSSSFVVQLEIKFKNGKKVFRELGAGSGDAGGTWQAGVRVEDSDENILFDLSMENYDEADIFSPLYEFIDLYDLQEAKFNLSDIVAARSVESLIKALEEPFLRGADRCYEDDEYSEKCDEDENEGIAETLSQWREQEKEYHRALIESLAYVSDIEKAGISMEWLSRGEECPLPDEVLKMVFGQGAWDNIKDALGEDWEDCETEELCERISGLDCCRNLTDNSLEEIIRMVTECDCSCEVYNVEQTLTENGKIELRISWEF